jgi:hypothetical protein
MTELDPHTIQKMRFLHYVGPVTRLNVELDASIYIFRDLKRSTSEQNLFFEHIYHGLGARMTQKVSRQAGYKRDMHRNGGSQPFQTPPKGSKPCLPVPSTLFGGKFHRKPALLGKI